MKTTIHTPAANCALALGLVAVTGLMPRPSLADAAIVAEPDRIILVQAEAEPVERPVTYTSEQADRGEERYEKECEECHGDDLKGGLNGGAPLRGMVFEEKFTDGLPASLMFSYMSTAMPPNSPGRYSASTYADLMAYILKRNGFNEGAPLPSDLEQLDYLIMDK